MNFTEEQKLELIQNLRTLIAAKKIKDVRLLLEKYPLADFAEALGELTINEQLYILRVLKTEDAADVFAYLDDDTKVNLAQSFTQDWGMEVLQELQTDELADVLEELPANITKYILSKTDPEKRQKLNNILSYDDDSIGSIMSVDMSILKSDWTVKKAISKIKKDYRSNIELTHNFYVVDDQKKLLGDITLEELVFADDEKETLDELYNVVTTVHPNDKKENAANIFADHDRSTLPVTTADGYLIGMITADDVIDVIQDSATEDMYKLAGINPEAAEESYLKTTIMQIVKSRVLWLIILMISATLSQFIIQKFTDVSEGFVNGINVAISSAILVGLIPIISGAAGNAGSQSSTTITRAASLGEIGTKDMWKVVGREVSIGAIIGAIMFVVNVARLYIYFAIPSFRESDGKTASWGVLSFVILASSLSLFFVVIFAKFLGTIIPLVAIKFKKDPAVMSAPILATLSDALSTLIFFGLNILVLFIAHSAHWI
ncbi:MULTISPECIES: magnesium transporter [unclassified Mycoplasma]|uniref:magnesium transporter n=1 Tax=unclassified Mycoplasma TaxID=2683645 RepID=UPI002B1DCCDA|nr:MULTISPECIES: magnesium transporter [unclassified Mycoplasma]MEA4134265.1 magnesium transporter [Mycoplasma sp. 2704]MEA4276078.1 magnesium transporter [Mycoplasma sp. 21DD0573]